MPHHRLCLKLVLNYPPKSSFFLFSTFCMHVKMFNITKSFLATSWIPDIIKRSKKKIHKCITNIAEIIWNERRWRRRAKKIFFLLSKNWSHWRSTEMKQQQHSETFLWKWHKFFILFSDNIVNSNISKL